MAAAVSPSTVLVIDDEKKSISMATDILEIGNHKTLAEQNPLRGMELYKRALVLNRRCSAGFDDADHVGERSCGRT